MPQPPASAHCFSSGSIGTPLRHVPSRLETKKSSLSASPPKNSCNWKPLMTTPTAIRSSSPPTNTLNRNVRCSAAPLDSRSPARSAFISSESSSDQSSSIQQSRARRKRVPRRALEVNPLRDVLGDALQLLPASGLPACVGASPLRGVGRRLHPQLLLALPPFLPLFEQDGTDGDEDEVEDEYLASLSIRRPDVPLKDGVGQRQHRRKD